MKILCTVLIATLCFALAANGQTKQLTIDWIKSKIADNSINLRGSFANSSDHYTRKIRYDANSVSDTVIFHEEDDLPISFTPDVTTEIRKANYNDLTNAEICSNCANDGNIAIILYFKSISYYASDNDHNYKPKTIYLYLEWHAEPNLQARMLTALQALVKFNGAHEIY